MTTSSSLQQSKIKNIVFDFGRVLVTWEPYVALQKCYPDKDYKAMADLIFGGEEWYILDQGVITEEEALLRMSQKSGLCIEEIKPLFIALEETVLPIKPMVEYLWELKNRGYGIYLLSNMSENDFQKRLQRFRFLRECDGLVYSAAVKLAKPDLEIYKLFLNQFKLKAQECVFIDDKKENIDPAIKLEMKGIVFQDYESLRDTLEMMLESSHL